MSPLWSEESCQHTIQKTLCCEEGIQERCSSFAYAMEYPIQPDNTFTTFKEKDVVFCHQT